MKNNSWFGLDKVFHCFGFLWLSFVLCALIADLWVFLLCLAIGFGIELLEMTDLWCWLMRVLGETEGRAHSIDWKDMVVNCIGTLMGILAYWSI